MRFALPCLDRAPVVGRVECPSKGRASGHVAFSSLLMSMVRYRRVFPASVPIRMSRPFFDQSSEERVTGSVLFCAPRFNESKKRKVCQITC